jgi:hypothetical protein
MKQYSKLNTWPRFQVEKKFLKIPIDSLFSFKNSYSLSKLVLKIATFPKILGYKKINSSRCLESGFTLSSSNT